jgi:hypothetical protein
MRGGTGIAGSRNKPGPRTHFRGGAHRPQGPEAPTEMRILAFLIDRHIMRPILRHLRIPEHPLPPEVLSPGPWRLSPAQASPVRSEPPGRPRHLERLSCLRPHRPIGASPDVPAHPTRIALVSPAPARFEPSDASPAPSQTASPPCLRKAPHPGLVSCPANLASTPLLGREAMSCNVSGLPARPENRAFPAHRPVHAPATAPTTRSARGRYSPK